MEASRKILKQYWGYDHFRPMQEDIIDSSINGHDVLALLPTGGGKSICFQIPGLAREGLTLVISPLIALMQDQVMNLNKKGIRAKELISGMSYREIDILLDNARFGGLDFLYTSPERLETKLFQERIKLTNLALIVVDEAHCISEWGQDFRPSYQNIKKLRELHPETPIIAVTATATHRVVEDIKKQLTLRQPEVFEASFLRKNLSYQVVETNAKLIEIQNHINANPDQTGIIYCQTRKSVKEVTRTLASLGHKVGLYHGGMSKEERSLMLNEWMNDKILVMVCTNAFGMGIDKPDVRFVLHYEFPDNLEAYFQEAGRAGRDEKDAQAIVYFNKLDVKNLEIQHEAKFPLPDDIKLVFRALCSYLKIAIGSGKNETYDIDIQDFSSKFKLDKLLIYHSLHILELNGDIVYSEGVFHPTKIRIAINNVALYSFQIKNPNFSTFLELISRSYPGIYDNYYQIDEREIAKRLKSSENEVKETIKKLEKNGILDVSWQSSKPTVTLEHERLPDDYLKISAEVYQFRKELSRQRLDKAISFLKEEKCRVQQLLNYFGQETEQCGTCDICLQRPMDFSKIQMKGLKKFLKDKRSLQDIKSEFDISAKFLEKILCYLILREEIKEENGYYQSK